MIALIFIYSFSALDHKYGYKADSNFSCAKSVFFVAFCKEMI